MTIRKGDAILSLASGAERARRDQDSKSNKQEQR
jgi:hypothetical protein